MSDEELVDTIINVLIWFLCGGVVLFFGFHILNFILKLIYGGGS